MHGPLCSVNPRCTPNKNVRIHAALLCHPRDAEPGLKLNEARGVGLVFGPDCTQAFLEVFVGGWREWGVLWYVDSLNSAHCHNLLPSFPLTAAPIHTLFTALCIPPTGQLTQAYPPLPCKCDWQNTLVLCAPVLWVCCVRAPSWLMSYNRVSHPICLWSHLIGSVATETPDASGTPMHSTQCSFQSHVPM